MLFGMLSGAPQGILAGPQQQDAPGMDPRIMGLLAAGAAGLEASGPSRMPVSLGQVAGRGLGAGLGSYMSSVEANRKYAQTQALIDLEKQKAALTKAQLDHLLAQEKRRADFLEQFQRTMQPQAQRPGDIDFMAANNQAMGLPPPERASAVPSSMAPNLQQAIYADLALNEGKNAGRLISEHAKPRALHFQDMGDAVQALDSLTGAPIGPPRPKAMTPGEKVTHDWQRFVFNNPSAAQQIDAGLRQQSNAIAAGGLANQGQRLYFDTGMTPAGVPATPMPSSVPRTPEPSPMPTQPGTPLPTQAPATGAPTLQHGPQRTMTPRTDIVGRITNPTMPAISPKQQQEMNAVRINEIRGAKQVLQAAEYDSAKGTDKVSSLIDASTSGLLQNAAAQVPGFFGHATTGRKAIGELNTFVSKLTMDMMGGKLGAGISNADRDFVVTQLGNVANANIPAGERKAAWLRARSLLEQRINNPVDMQQNTAVGSASNVGLARYNPATGKIER